MYPRLYKWEEKGVNNRKKREFPIVIDPISSNLFYIAYIYIICQVTDVSDC